MSKINFGDDYSEGCHPSILTLLSQTNFEVQQSYGEDDYSIKARNLLHKIIKNKNAAIHFVTGGTQANLIVIASALKPYEAVISATSGHINIHEAGAIEACGHKIIPVKNEDGKIRPADIQMILDEHIIIPHMVKPKMVYISNSSEVGTIYKKLELEALSSFCKENKLLLFMDGARLGSALTSMKNDLSLAEISKFTDIFSIGGTKNGALLGEVIIINNESLQENFGYHLKQRGALLSKGRILGIQFLALFKDDLFFNLSKHANTMALKISTAINQIGYPFLTESFSNQIFPIFPNEIIEQLSMKYNFYIWKKIDVDNSAIRLVTSWATKEIFVDEFISDLFKFS